MCLCSVCILYRGKDKHEMERVDEQVEEKPGVNVPRGKGRIDQVVEDLAS